MRSLFCLHNNTHYKFLKVQTNKAVFILISDFGAKERTAGMTLSELTAAVEEESVKLAFTTF